jgi:glycosyltransferase involved in cell wall biosynthesis
MVVLEAMACGTPVVASDVGGLTSTVDHARTGLLAPAGDWQAFARAILQLLGAPTQRTTFGQASVVRAQDFAWPRIVEHNIQLYRRLIRQHGAETRQLAACGQQPCAQD